jgi:hypothetical protein
MRGSAFQRTILIEPTASRVKKVELPLQLENTFLITMYTKFPLFNRKHKDL